MAPNKSGQTAFKYPTKGTKQMRSRPPTHPNWVPESSLAGNVRVGVRSSFGQTLPQKPSRTMGLVLQCRLHQKSAPQTNSIATSWHRANPARLPSSTQPHALSRCEQDRQHIKIGYLKAIWPGMFMSGFPSAPGLL